MKLQEHEAKDVFRAYGMNVAKGVVISKWTEDSFALIQRNVGENVVVKAQVNVGGRGKAGGVLLPDPTPAGIQEACERLLGSKIKDVLVEKVLVEERLSILHEFYVSITIDRSAKSPIFLFADDGGVDIEELARTKPSAVRKANVYPMCNTVPDYTIRHIVNQGTIAQIIQGISKNDLESENPSYQDSKAASTIISEIQQCVQRLYHIFREKDCTLVEINPLVITPKGVYAADAKIIVDDNALSRHNIQCNQDLSALEQEAEKHGFSFVELDGEIGVLGNGAGLTMATLDLIHQYAKKEGCCARPANFLDVGGGANQTRVSLALQMLEKLPNLKIIVVNLFGGITRCDEVALGIVAANLQHPVIVRLAGTNEEKGRAILNAHGYTMCQSMEEAISEAVVRVHSMHSSET